MYLLAYYIVPGIILGLIVPSDKKGWFVYILVVASVYSVVTMAIELLRGKAKARAWRSTLASELDAKKDSEIVAAAVLMASRTHQFIYRFHFSAFVVGCLTIAVPVTVMSAITYGFRCWLR